MVQLLLEENNHKHYSQTMTRRKYEYYFNITKAVAQGSTCLRRKYGAVIVKDDMIVSTGFNGSARKVEDCLTKNSCLREELNIPHGERYELCEAVHAEQNAILQGTPERMKGATIFIAGFDNKGNLVTSKPCKLCYRFILNAWITEIVYYDSELQDIVVKKIYNQT